jgi:hypothetical protein
MGWRRHSFEAGKRYRVVADCDVQLDKLYQFRVGDVLTFCQDSYSHYDNLSAYLFRTASGEERYWTLHDNEPEDKWVSIFEPINDNVSS